MPVDDTSALARTLVVRVWLPDRPGALGQVASRIGAVHADVTAIDILERGAGRVIDELVVSLPETTSVELLTKEIAAVDGVAVEHVRPAADRPDSATGFLALAADVAAAAPAARCEALCRGLLRAADADWTVAIRDEEAIVQFGDPPDLPWLLAFLEGSEHLDAARPANGPGDVLWVRLPTSGIAIAAGRAARAVHERERTRLALLASVADALLEAS